MNIEASGYYWQARGPVDYPTYTDPGKKYYITDNGSNNHKDLCASDADTDGWTADPTKNDPHTIYGLHWDGASQDRGAIVPNYPRQWLPSSVRGEGQRWRGEMRRRGA